MPLIWLNCVAHRDAQRSMRVSFQFHVLKSGYCRGRTVCKFRCILKTVIAPIANPGGKNIRERIPGRFPWRFGDAGQGELYLKMSRAQLHREDQDFGKTSRPRTAIAAAGRDRRLRLVGTRRGKTLEGETMSQLVTWFSSNTAAALGIFGAAVAIHCFDCITNLSDLKITQLQITQLPIRSFYGDSYGTN